MIDKLISQITQVTKEKGVAIPTALAVALGASACGQDHQPDAELMSDTHATLPVEADPDSPLSTLTGTIHATCPGINAQNALNIVPGLSRYNEQRDNYDYTAAGGAVLVAVDICHIAEPQKFESPTEIPEFLRQFPISE